MKILILLIGLGLSSVQDSSTVRHNANKAALLSAIFPGGGQFYTKHFAKGIVLGGLEMFFAYNALTSFSKAQSTSNDPYFQKFMSNALWFLAVRAFSIVDAYVSAHLNDFDSNVNRIRNDAKIKPDGG